MDLLFQGLKRFIRAEDEFGLEQDLAVVHFFIYQVDCDAAVEIFRPAGILGDIFSHVFENRFVDSLPVHSLSSVGREQSRMDVYDSARI